MNCNMCLWENKNIYYKKKLLSLTNSNRLFTSAECASERHFPYWPTLCHIGRAFPYWPTSG